MCGGEGAVEDCEGEDRGEGARGGGGDFAGVLRTVWEGAVGELGGDGAGGICGGEGGGAGGVGV